MKVGVFTPVLASLPLAQALETLRSLGISTIELGTGNWPGDAHCKLSMLDNPGELEAFQETLTRYGVTISALSCHGNPLHPDTAVAEQARRISHKTVLLAERLNVPVVIDFSGCPGDSPTAVHPNWVTCPWPPEFRSILDWQWKEIVAPYWRRHAQHAAEHGVRIAIEMHPGFVVYNPETMLRLRELTGETVGCNFDPSHLFWQQIDPIAAVNVLGDAVFHVHAKDTQMFPANLPRTGVLDAKPYDCERERGWLFRTCGYGHDALWWKQFVSALRLAGYDGTLSIEHEDSLLAPAEGLEKAVHFLQALVPERPSGPAWWV